MSLLEAHTNNYVARVNIATKVFEEYGDFIHAVIRCKVRNQTQADDLFQDFFLSLISNPPPPMLQNIKGYLYRAITNDIIDSTRRVEKYQLHIRRYTENLERSVTVKRPEKALIEVEEMDKMLKLIKKRLQDDEAQAIILRYRNNYKIKEIASKLDIKYKTTWRYVSKGLTKIRRFLRIR